jgi:aminoglycoside 3-N-acetyltransferase
LTRSASYSRHDLGRDLRQLGVAAGDVLFVHASLRSLGPVSGAAAAVVAALEDAVGPAGTILMPSFNLVPRHERAALWHIDRTPATTGYLSEFFRLMPGTVRSDHYSHSVAARGRDAGWFVADHRSLRGDGSPWDLPPWGRTYGHDAPMTRVYDRDGKVLMLGVDYQSSTYVHVAEVRLWNRRRRTDPAAAYAPMDRPAMGHWWDRQGQVSFARVGDAPCRLFRVRAFVDALVARFD